MTDDEEKALAEIERLALVPVRTHRDIAAALGLSHTNVQNIERRALAKMRRYAEEWSGGLVEPRAWPIRSDGALQRHARRDRT
jgi:hypothetical protein